MKSDNTNGHLSRMRKYESIAAICWLPMHIIGVPLLLLILFPEMDSVDLNFWMYAGGTAVLGAICARYLVSDMEPFWSRPGPILKLVLISFGVGLAGNAVTGLVVQLIAPGSNPNNDAVMELAGQAGWKVTVMTVFLAPVLEELIFRAGIFGSIRRKSRILAYIVCILLFSVYHVWGYAINDPTAWVYLLQYLPMSFLLCFCYEKTQCIWTSVLFHMANNAFSLWVLSLQSQLG
ncbi:MAG: CPBP family intramembrane metalloprotease [Oscillospiraceae bacterium]|nr:CPBP family intramembrane metalloprotease [Oscillospiraceae bacterium]